MVFQVSCCAFFVQRGLSPPEFCCAFLKVQKVPSWNERSAPLTKNKRPPDKEKAPPWKGGSTHKFPAAHQKRYMGHSVTGHTDWSYWSLCSVHTISSTGPYVSLDQPHKHENMIIWCMQLGHSFHLFYSGFPLKRQMSCFTKRTGCLIDKESLQWMRLFVAKKVIFGQKLKIAEMFGVSSSWSIM